MATSSKKWTPKEDTVLATQNYYDLVNAAGETVSTRKITGAKGVWKNDEKRLTSQLGRVPTEQEKASNYTFYIKALKLAGPFVGIEEAVKGTKYAINPSTGQYPWINTPIYTFARLNDPVNGAILRDYYDAERSAYKNFSEIEKAKILESAPPAKALIEFAKSITSLGNTRGPRTGASKGKGKAIGTRAASARYKKLFTDADEKDAWFDASAFDKATKTKATKKSKPHTAGAGKAIEGPREMRILSTKQENFNDFIDYLQKEGIFEWLKTNNYIADADPNKAKQVFANNMALKLKSKTVTVTPVTLSTTLAPLAQLAPFTQPPTMMPLTFVPAPTPVVIPKPTTPKSPSRMVPILQGGVLIPSPPMGVGTIPQGGLLVPPPPPAMQSAPPQLLTTPMIQQPLSASTLSADRKSVV